MLVAELALEDFAAYLEDLELGADVVAFGAATDLWNQLGAWVTRHGGAYRLCHDYEIFLQFTVLTLVEYHCGRLPSPRLAGSKVKLGLTLPEDSASWLSPDRFREWVFRSESTR